MAGNCTRAVIKLGDDGFYFNFLSLICSRFRCLELRVILVCMQYTFKGNPPNFSNSVRDAQEEGGDITAGGKLSLADNRI